MPRHGLIQARYVTVNKGWAGLARVGLICTRGRHRNGAGDEMDFVSEGVCVVALIIVPRFDPFLRREKSKIKTFQFQHGGETLFLLFWGGVAKTLFSARRCSRLHGFCFLHRVLSIRVSAGSNPDRIVGRNWCVESDFWFEIRRNSRKQPIF